jgi:hypothetical protein
LISSFWTFKNRFFCITYTYLPQLAHQEGPPPGDKVWKRMALMMISAQHSLQQWTCWCNAIDYNVTIMMEPMRNKIPQTMTPDKSMWFKNNNKPLGLPLQGHLWHKGQPKTTVCPISSKRESDCTHCTLVTTWRSSLFATLLTLV